MHWAWSGSSPSHQCHGMQQCHVACREIPGRCDSELISGWLSTLVSGTSQIKWVQRFQFYISCSLKSKCSSVLFCEDLVKIRAFDIVPQHTPCLGVGAWCDTPHLLCPVPFLGVCRWGNGNTGVDLAPEQVRTWAKFVSFPCWQLSSSFNCYDNWPYVSQDSAKLKMTNLYVFLAFIYYESIEM